MDVVLLLVAVFGLMRRRLPLTKARVVRGPAVLSICGLFVVPVSVSTGLALWPGWTGTPAGSVAATETSVEWTTATAVACLVLGLVIALATARREPAGGPPGFAVDREKTP